jgi:hypothetical protein
MDTTFCGFIQRRYPVTKNKENYFGLSEITEYFPRDAINALFRKELERLLDRPSLQPHTREELQSLLNFDVVGYVDKSLRRAGFSDPDLDPLVQDLAVKLLVTGNLFSGWTGEGSFKARFLVSLKNAIATLIKKKQVARNRSHELPIDAPGREEQDGLSLVDDFRDYLRSHVGPVAVTVFDQRLAGEDTKELIGQQGIETSYRLKRIVAEIKEAAMRFAARDPDFHSMIQRAFEREAQTMEKRFKRVGA